MALNVPPIQSGMEQGGYTSAWRFTFESETLEPQVFSDLIQLYGMQLSYFDFVAWAGRTFNVQTRNLKVLSEGFVHDVLDVETEVGVVAAGAQFTLSSNSNYGRIGFDVHVPAEYTPFKIAISYQITAKSGTGPYSYTLVPYKTTHEIDTAIPVGTKLMTGASGFAPGTQQPAAVRRAWYEHYHESRIMKSTVWVEGGQPSLKEWAALRQAKDGSTLVNRSLNEAEFNMRLQLNDYMLMGQKNTNGLTGDNRQGETQDVLSDDGLLHTMLAKSMIQYYVGTYGAANFDTIKFLLASQGVGKGVVDFCYGQELGLGIENSGLQFINEFSGGTDLYKNMSDLGFVLKKFTKNGIVNMLNEIPEFANPVMYNADPSYNFAGMGFIFPNAKVTADMSGYDSLGRSTGEYTRKAMNHVSLAFLAGNGENRKLVVGDQAGVNGLGLKFTDDWDSVNYYMLSEAMTVLTAMNQGILVLRSD